MAVALSNLSARWAASASAVNTAIKMKVTDTTSAANSKLIEFTVNDVSKFAVEKSGNVHANFVIADSVYANTLNVITSTVINETEINVTSTKITANSIATSNLSLGGVNAITWISSSYDQANTSRNSANAVSDSASAGYNQANTARTHANSAFAKANAALPNTTTTLGGSLTMQSIRLTSNTTIPTAATAGSTGQIYWDGEYLYVCVATNQWKRVAISSW